MPKTSQTKRKRQVASQGVVKLARAVVRAAAPSPMPGISLGSGFRTGGFRTGVGRGVNMSGLPELKTIDSGSVGPTNFSTAGAVLLLNGVAQGDDYTNRIGRKITMKSILMRFSVFSQATDNLQTGDILRVMIVYDNQSNGVAPTVANILQTASWDSPQNLDNRDRFLVLADKVFNRPAAIYAAGVITAGQAGAASRKIYRKISLQTQFNGTGATVGSIAGGSVYMLTISAYGAQYDYYSNCRIRFTDN